MNSKNRTKKVVSLSVHKNTQDKRRRHRISGNLIRTVKEYGKDFNGFALVTWDECGEASVVWNRGNLPISMLPGFVEVSMMRGIAAADAARGEIPEIDGGDDAS